MIVLKHVVSRNVKNNPRVFLFELQTKPGGVLIQTDHGFAKKTGFYMHPRRADKNLEIGSRKLSYFYECQDTSTRHRTFPESSPVSPDQIHHPFAGAGCKIKVG